MSLATRRLRKYLFPFATICFLLACSARQDSRLPAASPQNQSDGRDSEGPNTSSPQSDEVVLPPEERAAPLSIQEAETVPVPVQEAEEESCPEDMILVEGDYCTALSNEHQADASGNTPGQGSVDIQVIQRKCLKEWYAPQNKKRVCELFEENAECSGKLVKKKFCIDKYAWPNRQGHRPEVMNRFYQAQVKCAAVDKRLCTESEWSFSCEGPEMKPFPYGYERDASQCHGDEPWDSPNMMKVAKRDQKELRRVYHAKRSGQPGCVSDFGVYDLPGNNDEIVASETENAGWRSKFESVTTGGPWHKGVRNQCRPKIYSHDEGYYSYNMGFRCCADASEEATDPRTPRQKREGWSMKRVEGIAGVSVAEMREILEKKKNDPSCGCRTKRCRTLCGTLHGDEWSLPEAPSVQEQSDDAEEAVRKND